MLQIKANTGHSANTALQDTSVLKLELHVTHVIQENLERDQSSTVQIVVYHARQASMQKIKAQKNVMCAEVDFIIIKLPHSIAKDVLVAVIYRIQDVRVQPSVRSVH